MFSVRLVTADSYQAQPLPQLDPTFSEFRGSEIKHVPIIRIFGTTVTGEKACLHIHGVFPYLYVPYTGEEDPISLAYKLATSLDAAINVSLGSATSITQHVYLIQRVSGTPFYGYHRKEHQYLKIYFYNPSTIKRAADLLQNGSVLNQNFQPHEAHIPYLLQFMIDYNVYGMNLVNLSGVKHRRLTQTLAELASSGQSTASDKSDIEYLPATIERQSTCEIEVDARAADIMNRREIESGLELNPGLAAIWEEERARRCQAGLQGGDSQLVNPKSPPRPTFHPTDNDIYQEQRLARRLLTISQCDESTLSTTNQSVAYAAEVQEGENLLNSSYLPFSRPTVERVQLVERDNPTLHTSFLASPAEVASQRNTPECSILGTDDMSLIDLLYQLADEGTEKPESVDMDSLLGSQVSEFLNDEKSFNEDDDAVDLNLTSLQLDSLSSLEIAAEQAAEPTTNDQNPRDVTNISPFTSSYGNSSSSRSADEEKASKGCRVPQYDGAGDISPTLLNSDDEDTGTNAKQCTHLSEYTGGRDPPSKPRKFEHLEQTLRIPSSNDVAASKDTENSGERCRSPAPIDSTVDTSSLLPVLPSDAYLAQYNGNSYEPLDRLLENDSEFNPDFQGFHSSMEIGVLLSSADSDSPESVDEALEDDAIPLETVLNGDPCFTESAELDKSDLAELQDQYVSLLGNSLLPDVHANVRIESDAGNSSNISDSDYQTSEKTCEIMMNARSPRSSIASRESSSSSENAAPNIQEPEAKACARGKFNASYALDTETQNCKDLARISTDNSDYNCNVVATWAELQNLQFVEKEKMEERMNRSRERGQHSQGPRQNQRRAVRCSDEKSASQILCFDRENITNGAAPLVPVQVNYNCTLSPQKIVVSNSSPKKSVSSPASPIAADAAAPESKISEIPLDIVDKNCSLSPRVPEIAGEIEIENQPSFADSEVDAHPDVPQESFNGSDNLSPHAAVPIEDTAGVDDDASASVTADFDESTETRVETLEEPLPTKEIPEGSSHYSSLRSHRPCTAGGFGHRHCQVLANKIFQCKVFTSEQIWVIEKRKRGRQKRTSRFVCNRTDCRLPVVALTKIDAKSDENATVVENSEHIDDTGLPVDEIAAETPENHTVELAVDTLVETSNLSSKPAVVRKTRIRRKRIDFLISNSSADVPTSSSDSSAEENENIGSINKAIGTSIEDNRENPKDLESSEAKESSGVGDLACRPHGARRRFTRKERSIARNSKKLLSTKASKTTRYGMRRRVSRAGIYEESNLPGIPGIVDYRPSRKRGYSKKNVFASCNGVASSDKITETPRNADSKPQSMLFANCKNDREVSGHLPNGLANCVQNCLTDNQKLGVASDRRALSCPQLDFPPVSPIPKRNLSPRDNSRDFSDSVLNRSSTPKKIDNASSDPLNEKVQECVTLKLMMQEVNCASTREKLKLLLEQRRNTMKSFMKKKTNAIAKRRPSSSEKRCSDAKNCTPSAPKDAEAPPVSAISDHTSETVEGREIDDKLNTGNDMDEQEQSFETVADCSESGRNNCESLVNSFKMIKNCGIFGNSTLNTDLSAPDGAETTEIFEAELQILGREIPEANPNDELSNERKELSYQSDQFASTIVEENFFSGHYTIDAVSLEMPACLFEDDSCHVDKRSPKKVASCNSASFTDLARVQDAVSDISVEPRDLDVCDVESLTTTSSLVASHDTTLDDIDASLNTSEATEFSVVENSTHSKAQNLSTSSEKSLADSKSETLRESSFEEESPEFEALSPRPRIFANEILEKSLEEEFTVYSKVEIARNAEKSANSFCNTVNDSPTEKEGTEDENLQLDNEIQELASQVIVQFDNGSNLPSDNESTLNLDILPPNIIERTEEIVAESAIEGHQIEEPSALIRDQRGAGLQVAPEDTEQLFSESESVASIASEKSQKVQTPVESLEAFPGKTDTEKVDNFAVVRNRAQSDVLDPQIERQTNETRESEPMDDQRLEPEDENEEPSVSLVQKSIESDENKFGSQAKDCESENKELTGTPKRPLKCRPVSIKLVNINLSILDDSRSKDFPEFDVAKLKPVEEIVDNINVDNFTDKNIMQSTSPNTYNETIEQIISVEVLLINETNEENETKIRSEKVTSESSKSIEISSGCGAPETTTSETKNSMKFATSVEVLNEDEIPAGTTSENKKSMEAAAPVEILDEEETPKTPTSETKTSMESATPVEVLNEDEIPEGTTSENKNSMESTTSVATCDQSETAEKTMSSIEIPNKSETFEETTPMETKSASKSVVRKVSPRMLKVSRPAERRSVRMCAEKTRQKLSKRAKSQRSAAKSQPSISESQPSTEQASRIVAENDSQESVTQSQDERELNNVLEEEQHESLKTAMSTEHLPNVSKNSSTNVPSPQKSTTGEKGAENSLESVLSAQKIPNEITTRCIRLGKRFKNLKSSQRNLRETSPKMNASKGENSSEDENMKPKSSYCCKHALKNKRGRPIKMKRKRPLQLKQAVPRVSKTTLDSKPPALQPISSDKMDQENTCSLYDRLSQPKMTETNCVETNTCEEVHPKGNVEKIPELIQKPSIPECQPLEAEKNSPRIIGNSNVSPKSSETPKRRNRVAKTPVTNLPKLSMETIATLEESARNIPQKTSAEIEVNICEEVDESKNTPDTEIPLVIGSNPQPKEKSQDIAEKSPQRVEASPQNIDCMKRRKMGRPRMCSKLKFGKSAKLVATIKESTRDVDEKASDISEVSQSSQNIEEEDSDSKTTGNTEIPELNTQNLSADKNEASQKLEKKEDEVSVSQAEGPESNTSKSSPASISSAEESSEANSDPNNAKKDSESKICPIVESSEPNDLELSPKSKSLLVETTQDTVKDTFQENDSSLPNTADRNIQSIIFVEPVKIIRPVKLRRGSARSYLEESKPDNEKLQQPELLVPTIAKKSIQSDSTPRRVRLGRSLKLNDRNVSADKNSKSTSRAASQCAEIVPATLRRSCRALKSTKQTLPAERKVQDIVEESLKQPETLQTEITEELLEAVSVDAETKDRQSEISRTIADKSSQEQTTQKIARKISSKLAEELLESESVNSETKGRQRKISRTIVDEPSQKEAMQKIAQKISPKIMKELLEAESVDAATKSRQRKISRTTVDELSQEQATRKITQKISPKIAEETLESESVNVETKGRQCKISRTIVDESSQEQVTQKIARKISPKIAEETLESESVNVETKGRQRKISRTIVDESSQEQATRKITQKISPKIAEETLESESVNVETKSRQRKISRTIVDGPSQEQTTQNTAQKISPKTVELSSQKLEDEENESKISVKTLRRCRPTRNSEDTPKTSVQESSVVIATKMTKNTAKSTTRLKSKKRTRSNNSPEAESKSLELSEEPAPKISEETIAQPNILPQKNAKEISEPQISARPQKRPRLNEGSIRECAISLSSIEVSSEPKIVNLLPNEHPRPSLKNLNGESSPASMNKSRILRKGHGTKKPEATSHRGHLSQLKNDQNSQQLKDLADPKGNNGVAAKSESTIRPSDNASLDLPSLQGGFTRQHRRENTCEIPAKPTMTRAQVQRCRADERLPSMETQLNNSENVGQPKSFPHLTNFKVCSPDSSTRQAQSELRVLAFVQLQEPKIYLKRLSRDTLRSYGFQFSAKKKIFVKILKKRRPDPDYQVPAYDGAADFSSSDSDDTGDDPIDVTIVREEKRVCVYQSGKKSASAGRDAIFTPQKRKLDEKEDEEHAQSSMSKHRALATPGPSSKMPYHSPNRTSMLKSPGRVSGYYPPLQIIVTSPKVRKETFERRDTDARLENRNVPASPGECLTPRRKNDQRLHENLLRGRIAALKSPRNSLGDKRAPVATTRSERPGELDEIRPSELRERNALSASTTTRECPDTTGNQNLTMTFKDGKDVRKKLVFSTAGDELQRDKIDETPNAELGHPSTKSSTSNVHAGRFSSTDIAEGPREVVENLASRETTPDPQPEASRSVDENLALYDATTDEESEGECDVTFTQYIDSHIEKNQIFTIDRNKIGPESNEIVSLRPKFNPPSRQRIIDTMETYGIPKYRNQEPFFSDEADVPKQKELAQRMLKVPGKGLKDLPQFVSSVEGVTGLARWRRMKINELQPALAKSKGANAIRALVGDDLVSLTPLTNPPTVKEVKNWLRAREYLEKRKQQEEAAKKSTKMENNEIQGEVVGEEEECGSNASDVSIIEVSPETIVGINDSEKKQIYTSKMKIAKRKLMKKAEYLQRSRLVSSDDETAKVSGSGEVPSPTNNSDSAEIDPSLLSVLGKSRLFKNQEASKHLGISCGQIEYFSDSTRSNVAKENLQNVKALTRYQYLTVMCLEVHVTTRGDLLPDAQHDPIAAIFYSVQSDVPPSSSIKSLEHGVIIVADEERAMKKMHYAYASKVPWSTSFANNEEALLNALVTLITRTDPEILIGWELETLSWGYVFQRASHLGMNLSKRISRIPATQCKWEAPAPEMESLADVKLPGRIVLDIWRIMRHEAALLSYTFESMMHHILNERVPCPSFKVLTDWWNLERPRPTRWRVVEHYSLRVLGIFRMLDHLDIIGRTSELARLFGIQFFEVFSRGSQYRVESVMHRLAKPLNYIAVSPTPLQRASMRAMEALPLIMEPESMFYSDPLIVLDFQSLYPSIIIAHNYCFSTCLGRIEHIGQPQPFEFGAYTLRVPKGTALKLQGKVNFAPCGVAFVKPEVRLGILPRMLTEILETRFMVKKAMKDHKQADKTLQRALHSRQLGLKLLANVTYGYTSANFSGRMPCIEVGDSVVSKSKETLERAIKLVEATPKWGARVVYGDTDSLFILVPGKSKADAFVIGNEIADAVTAANPPPIKLKFEKVMYPSILQTKKRYCGYMYETPEQETPTYLAKGIETVRRDGCPAVSKILEKTLKILFDTKDVSLVKMYVTRQLDKILRGKVSIQDLTFAKEFRGLKGYRSKACVPALELTRRLMRRDPRAVPRNSERVRYIIVAGAPNQALIHCVRTPWELINDPGLRPNAVYYVTRVIIPPLNRCLNLMGVDVNAWYREMPHRQILNNPVGRPVDKQKLTIFQYFGTIVCVSCGQPSSKGICAECLAHPADTLVVIHEKLRWLDRTYDHVTSICQSCVGRADAAECSSLDCPILYRRAQAQREFSQATHLRSIIECGDKLEF